MLKLSFLFILLVSCKNIILNNDSISKSQFQGQVFSNFGDSDGIITSDINPLDSSAPDSGYSIKEQSDGKILIAGVASNNNVSGPSDGFISRYHSNGSLDTSFNLTGTFIYNGVEDRRDQFYDVVQVGSKIYGFGFSRASTTGASSRALIVKLNLDGSFDNSFGVNGVLHLYAANETSFLFRGAVDVAGNIFVNGARAFGGAKKIFVGKILSNGTIDTSFATSGFYELDSGISYGNTHLEILGSGKILAYATVGADSNNYETNLIRLNSNGSLDTSLNGTGLISFSHEVKNYPESIIIDGSSYYILLSSFDSASWNRSIVKVNSSGAIDTSWGTVGVLSLNAISPAFSSALGIKKYGKDIIIASTNGGQGVFGSINISSGLLNSNVGNTNGYLETQSTLTNVALRGIYLNPLKGYVLGTGSIDSTSGNTKVLLIKVK